MRFGIKEKCSRAGAHLQSRGSLLVFLAFGFGLLALLWGSPSSKDWNLALDSLDFPSVSTVYSVFVLLFLLFLGFSVWRLGRRFDELEAVLEQFRKVMADQRSGLGFSDVVCASCGSKFRSWKGYLGGSFKGGKEPVVERTCSPKWECKNCIGRNGMKDLSDELIAEEGAEDGEEEEGFDGDELMKLRKEIEKERRLRTEAVGQLEEERRAATSAADEAMAKILSLQNEKASVEREARRYHEIAEQRKAYDEQYIEQLQWLIEKLESEKGEMEGKFEPGGQKIKVTDSDALSGKRTCHLSSVMDRIEMEA
uniref:Protein FLOURY 1 n=1 Tax=Elaeis guineensis var. tenera TaxID=51953 RepID=A0A6I9RU04_ELAGV|nr:protein FLOURY 1 [Elaeis guineensis]XP_010932554.1 protein FLOURY 1 [Elaeis guineensis]